MAKYLDLKNVASALVLAGHDTLVKLASADSQLIHVYLYHVDADVMGSTELYIYIYIYKVLQYYHQLRIAQ